YTRALEMLYNAIGDVTGSQVIVDPSKNAGYAYILSMLPGIDLYILHLVRDPRATAYSWLRKKVGLRREKPVKSVLEWSVRNMVAEGIGHISPKRYQRLRYEDFVKRPVETSKRILDFLEKPNLDLPFVSDHEAALGVNHTIYGNPNRFHSGLVKIKLDDAWQTIRKTDKAIIVALTWPFLFQYGYPIMVRRHTRSHDAHEFNEISADHEQIN
nr:sulfotransferase [candidate division KSB1 bacterium]NIR68893.1 sulfotransferase [candidate division KSB1 bacterium]NIS22574.1 sulfotransferase [candidate division KSB1 bacterium]NIT69419.1 sulfotransferase [candidate division KSB1 bacterium]NIU23074.1 sulfotransferase [candidate division KSB1 bacterium]